MPSCSVGCSSLHLEASDELQVEHDEQHDDAEQDDRGGRGRVGIADRRQIPARDVGSEDRLDASSQDQRQLEDPESVDSP